MGETPRVDSGAGKGTRDQATSALKSSRGEPTQLRPGDLAVMAGSTFWKSEATTLLIPSGHEGLDVYLGERDGVVQRDARPGPEDGVEVELRRRPGVGPVPWSHGGCDSGRPATEAARGGPHSSGEARAGCRAAWVWRRPRYPVQAGHWCPAATGRSPYGQPRQVKQLLIVDEDIPLAGPELPLGERDQRLWRNLPDGLDD
jgi:hypothetical protein